MSVEQIVLLVIFLVVPLVQHLLRAMGKGDEEEEPAQAERQPRPVPQRRPPAPPPQPQPIREWQPPPVLLEESLPDEEFRPAGRRPLVEAVGYVRPLPAPPPRQFRQRGPAVLGLYNRPDLRRAIVLMTVLEPCRANRSHEQK